MPQNDSPHALRLYESLVRHTDEKTASQIASEMPLSKSANARKKFDWAARVCGALDSKLDMETALRVRMDCACGPALSKMEQLRKLYRSAADMDSFAASATAKGHGFLIEHENGALALSYPRCYCSCVKDISENAPKSWCLCTLGYTKKMFEYVLGKSVAVELVSSVKTGADICYIKIIY